jgi:hypothetical protein
MSVQISAATAQDDDEVNPFLTLGLSDDINEDLSPAFDNRLDRDAAALRSLLALVPPPSTSTKETQLQNQRNWGIPSFEEQCNGLCTVEITVHEKTVVLELEHRRFSTGSDLWDSALVLSHALAEMTLIEGTDSKSVRGKSVLELGSGTGAVGLVCARCLMADRVIMTDLEQNLGLIERNVHRNQLVGAASWQVLDWQDDTAVANVFSKLKDSSPLDLIVGSDLFLPFAKHLLQPLARTLRDLLIHPVLCTPNTVACICYEERFDVSEFFRFASGFGLAVSEVCPQLLHPFYRDPGIHILRITV